MPLRLVRSTSSRTLWNACRDRFLDAALTNVGPDGHPAHIWITQRALRDSLLEEAFDRGGRGWLAPPISFFSELPEHFELSGRPAGLLTRRRMVARIASTHAGRLRVGSSANRGIIRGHMMDGLLGELLPEGTPPERLEAGLQAVAADEFATRRNEWIVSVYRDYLRELTDLGLYDTRSVHALLAERIEEGSLPAALRGARELHVYGLYTLRSRLRLITALATQREIDVTLYTLQEDEPGEWDELAGRLGLEVEVLPAEAAEPECFVQPAPDALREFGWIAQEVKRRLTAGGVEPHEIAVVAREGGEDTRRACTALEAAGVPCTARIRMQLSEIGALKAVLELFRGAATEWSYRALRNVLTSPYFRTGIDLRGIDFAARQRRITGLSAWADALERLAHAKAEGSDRDARDIGVHEERLERDAARLRELEQELSYLAEPRTERQWVELTASMVGDGILGLRANASRPVGDRWSIVRFDQRGLRQLQRLLREWAELDLPEDAMSPSEWHHVLQRLLEAHELALSTPDQKGVQVIEAQDAALLPFPVVYAVHANDGQFPRAASPRGVLLEEERSTLRRSGLPIADRDLNLRRERILWRAAVQADRFVGITYRTTDPAGTPLLASPMVPPHDPSTELPRSFELAIDFQEDAREQLGSPEEERRYSAVRLRRTAGRGEPVDAADAPALRRAIIAAHAETMRGVRNPAAIDFTHPNPWHGELRDPHVLERLATRYGPDHVWSASQLESYASCPFIFLVDRVLRLRPMREAEEETSPLAFGGIAHQLLHDFYEALKDELPASFSEVSQEWFDALADEAFRRRAEQGEWLGLPVLWRHKREELRETIRAYVQWELEHMNKVGERPVWCELELTRDGEPITIEGFDREGVWRTLRFTGRIDRVDVQGSGEGAVYHVLDYKSSSAPSRSGYLDGSVLQAALYLEGVAQLEGVASRKGRYRIIKKPGQTKNSCEVVRGDKYFTSALEIAFSIPARLVSGLFEPVKAKAAKWESYDPGIEITRTRATLAEGSRFDG